MSFDVAADAYQRFMGRYSEPLAEQMVELVHPVIGQHAIDVGAGPGALTAQLVALLGADAVAAVDPSKPFVEALRERLPGVDVKEGTAAVIPFSSDSFDLAVAQLVIHFMPDPVAGLREMARVVTPGGTVAASGWDFGGGRSPLALFWRAATDVDPAAPDESGYPGARDGELAEYFKESGLRDIRSGELTVSVPYSDFEDWWQPYELGVGPVGDYLGQLPAEQRYEVRARAEQLLGSGPGTIVATAWTAVGTV